MTADKLTIAHAKQTGNFEDHVLTWIGKKNYMVCFEEKMGLLQLSVKSDDINIGDASFSLQEYGEKRKERVAFKCLMEV